MDDSDPDTIICTKKDNPLIIGLGKGENFIASDIPAVINRTRQIYIMNDYELAVVKKDIARIKTIIREKETNVWGGNVNDWE